MDAEDKALHTTLPREFGWIMSANINAFRKVQLQTDIGLSGVFTLTLSGTGTFRVWQSANPGTNNIPNVDCAVNILVRRITDRRPVSEL